MTPMQITAILATSAALLVPTFSFAGGTALSGKVPTTVVPDEPATLFGTTLFDSLKAEKDGLGIPITVGAWHWWRFGDDGPSTDGYGIPGLRGTYYWTVDVDPKLKLDGPTFQEIGLHTQIRLREDGEFRPFIDDQVWTWEAYVYAKTTFGTVKAGQVWKRFGLDWDGVFYGNVAYFDGMKLDPDLGVSWEHTFGGDAGFKLDTIAQFFVSEDGINGSLAGADAESSDAFREENTGVLRLVPTWTFANEASLALGLSGSVGRIAAESVGFGDGTYSALAADLTYKQGNFSIFGELAQSHGTINPVRYVSGGPSDRITDYLVGASYKTGPITWRTNYSEGRDNHPGGKQSLLLPGMTIALTPNVDLYAEYVNWIVKPDGLSESDYEDGFQLALNWRF